MAFPGAPETAELFVRSGVNPDKYSAAAQSAGLDDELLLMDWGTVENFLRTA